MEAWQTPALHTLTLVFLAGGDTLAAGAALRTQVQATRPALLLAEAKMDCSLPTLHELKALEPNPTRAALVKWLRVHKSFRPESGWMVPPGPAPRSAAAFAAAGRATSLDQALTCAWAPLQVCFHTARAGCSRCAQRCLSAAWTRTPGGVCCSGSCAWLWQSRPRMRCGWRQLLHSVPQPSCCRRRLLQSRPGSGHEPGRRIRGKQARPDTRHCMGAEDMSLSRALHAGAGSGRLWPTAGCKCRAAAATAAAGAGRSCGAPAHGGCCTACCLLPGWAAATWRCTGAS